MTVTGVVADFPGYSTQRLVANSNGKAHCTSVRLVAAEAQQVKLSMSSAVVMQYIALSQEYALLKIAKEKLDIRQMPSWCRHGCFVIVHPAS